MNILKEIWKQLSKPTEASFTGASKSPASSQQDARPSGGTVVSPTVWPAHARHEITEDAKTRDGVIGPPVLPQPSLGEGQPPVDFRPQRQTEDLSALAEGIFYGKGPRE